MRSLPSSSGMEKGSLLMLSKRFCKGQEGKTWVCGPGVGAWAVPPVLQTLHFWLLILAPGEPTGLPSALGLVAPSPLPCLPGNCPAQRQLEAALGESFLLFQGAPEPCTCMQGWGHGDPCCGG